MGRRAHLPSMQIDRDLAKRRTGAPGLRKKAATNACTQCSYRQAIAGQSRDGPISCRNVPQLEQSLSATRFR